MIIAVDGPVAAGKGTLARALAAKLGLAYLDTGAIYRAVAAVTLAAGDSVDDEDVTLAVAKGLGPGDLERSDLRGEEVGQAASIVAAQERVRAALLDFQRRFAYQPPGGARGAVLDGRDVGTVVCPDAELKLFVTASAEVRAQRRYQELLARGEATIYPRVLKDLEERDARDQARSTAPLKPADDAVILDTSDLDAAAALQAAMRIVHDRGLA